MDGQRVQATQGATYRRQPGGSGQSNSTHRRGGETNVHPLILCARTQLCCVIHALQLILKIV